MVDMTVTRTTSLPGIFDTDVDGQIDPGETFLTTIEITNIAAGTLTGLDVSDAFLGSTVNSVRITPIAGDESFNITGNTPVVYTFAQLLGNDVDPDGSHASLTISGIAAQVNGTAVIDNMAQTVTFTPDTGLDIGQTASFTYTITDAQGLTNVAGSGGAGASA